MADAICWTWTRILLLTILVCSANSNSVFYLKLDEFENYEAALSSHAKCDSGNSPCDPAFSIKVRGIWGEIQNISDCYSDANHINFERTIGTALPNPLLYPESAIHFPITIDIRVKDCFLRSPADDIADFYETLNDLPKPYLYGETVDPDRDLVRVRRLDLQSLSPAPMSIKMRISVWHKCARYYYGDDCATFCKATLPGYGCNADGVPTCMSSSCLSTTRSSTRSASTKSAPDAATSTVATSTGGSTAKATTAGTSSSSSSSSSSSTKAASKTQEEAAVTSSDRGIPTKIRSETSGSPPQRQTLNTVLVASLAALLAVAILAVVLVLALLPVCSRRRLHMQQAPVMSSVVRFNRTEIGMTMEQGESHQLQLQQNFANRTYAMAPAGTDGAAAGSSRPDSGLYEDPVDPAERELPPLPARNSVDAFDWRQAAADGQCRSFSK